MRGHLKSSAPILGCSAANRCSDSSPHLLGSPAVSQTSALLPASPAFCSPNCSEASGKLVRCAASIFPEARRCSAGSSSSRSMRPCLRPRSTLEAPARLTRRTSAERPPRSGSHSLSRRHPGRTTSCDTIHLTTLPMLGFDHLELGEGQIGYAPRANLCVSQCLPDQPARPMTVHQQPLPNN